MERISSKKRVIMAGALAVLIAIALVIKFGGGAAARLAEQQLAGQNLVAGSITYEKMNAGFAGDVEIHNLVWKAPNGDIKMELPLATVSVNFFDALRQGGGLGAITNVVLNRPKLYGIYEEGQGLDILNLLKLAGQAGTEADKKEEVPVKPTSFRGLIELKEGSLDLISNGKKVQLDKINAQMAFKQYPLLRASAIASKGNCDLVMNMDYENGAARVTGEAKNASVPDVLAMYPDLDHIRITMGEVPTVRIAASKDKDGWHISLEGNPRSMAGSFFDVPFTEGEGSFLADRDVAVIRNIKASVNGMPVILSGIIKSGRGTPHPPGFDLSFSASGFKTRSLSKGLYLDDAAVSFSGKVTGTAMEPKIEGRFSSNYIYAAPLKLTEVKGSFVWDTGKIMLKNGTALGAGAPVALTGFLQIPSRDFDFVLLGNNMDAARLTDNQVTGVVGAEVQVKGKDQADSASGSGWFEMQKGRYFYSKGNLRSDEIRYMEGEIVVQNGRLGSQNAAMKLGRNKYNISIVSGDKDGVEVRIGEKTSSLF